MISRSTFYFLAYNDNKYTPLKEKKREKKRHLKAKAKEIKKENQYWNRWRLPLKETTTIENKLFLNKKCIEIFWLVASDPSWSLYTILANKERDRAAIRKRKEKKILNLIFIDKDNKFVFPSLSPYEIRYEDLD